MTLEQAIAFALQETPEPAPPETLAAKSTYPADLTEREVEVLRWLAKGLSDADIAKQLVISRRTVHFHLRGIYSKLDVTNRAAAARVALELNLV